MYWIFSEKNYFSEKSSEKYLWEKLHQTEFGVCMSSVKTEVGETTEIKYFFQVLLHHTDYSRRMSSVGTELGKRTGL